MDNRHIRFSDRQDEVDLAQLQELLKLGTFAVFQAVGARKTAELLFGQSRRRKFSGRLIAMIGFKARQLLALIAVTAAVFFFDIKDIGFILFDIAHRTHIDIDHGLLVNLSVFTDNQTFLAVMRRGFDILDLRDHLDIGPIAFMNIAAAELRQS